MQAENKLGVMPIKKLIWNMSLPIIVSMLVQALYNIVDSVFVSWVSEASLTAVSLAFPAQNLMISLAAGTAVGGRAHVKHEDENGVEDDVDNGWPVSGAGGLRGVRRAGADSFGLFLPQPDGRGGDHPDG